MPTTDLTYRQQEKASAFDWNDFLRVGAPTRTAEQWAHAAGLAGNWVTCAVGNQCAVLPRTWDGTPLDRELAQLGNQFYYYIRDKQLRNARRTLLLIENRSAYLLAQLTAKPENP